MINYLTQSEPRVGYVFLPFNYCLKAVNFVVVYNSNQYLLKFLTNKREKHFNEQLV